MKDLTESPEERELNKVLQTRKRIIIMGCVLALSVGARVVFKNPPPPKAPDHNDRPFRALPGVLKNLPESERKKLTPQQLAMLEEADRTGLAPKKQTEQVAKAVEPVTAKQDLSKLTIEDFKKYEYAAKKMRKESEIRPEYIDPTKDTIVLFNGGGHLQVRDAERVNGSVRFEVDRTIYAKVPKGIVQSILSNALNWAEPIPAGYSKLKPAPGITIIVASPVAKRITVQNGF